MLFCSSILYAQPGSVPVETRNGKQYYVHTVEKGQTSYGISRLYTVGLNELFESNPEAESGLSIGQKLYIPVKGGEAVVPDTPDIPDTPEALQAEGDQNFLYHTVQPKETMYSIARKYGVPAADLIEANGGSQNLSINQKIKVPLKNVKKDDEVDPIVKDPINPTANPGDSIIIHKVRKGETLYSLSKQYNVTIEAITAANDGLPEGLKKGMKLRIPLKKVVTTPQIDTTAIVVEPPVDVVPVDSSVLKNTYDVAVMLPFMFKVNEAKKAKCPPVGDCPIYTHTYTSLNFHHGIMLAIDSLKKAGMNVNVHVYDTENDTAVVNGILRKPEFANMDIIFGPLFGRQIKVVSKYAKSKGIQVVCPVPVSNKALFNNPSVTKMVASIPTQVEYMAKYVAAKYHDQNVILIRNQKSEKDEYYYKVFKKTYNMELAKYENRSTDSVKESYVNSSGSGLKAVEAKMLADKNNILVVPSTSVGHVSNFFTKLSTTGNKNPYRTYPVEIFGMEEWASYETVDEKYKNKFKLHMCVSGFIDYGSSEVNEFIAKYRSTYETDPNRYAYMGFDAAFVNLKGLFLYGTGFRNQYNLLNNSGYYTDSDFQKVDATSGYENKNVFIIRHNEYHVEKVK